ncbi:MAG: hypothetical protein JJE22_14740 [Bacteroidia bacterium]|nr:hypothetical protein [Bacteroidia bacterium]
MNSQKFLVGGIVGGIVYFLLGWLIYGMLLRDFMSNNMSAPGIMKADADMIWWALIVGNILMGFLVTYVLSKAKATSAGAGAGVGFVLGLLMSLSYDLIMFATSNVMSSLKGLAVDVAVSAVMSAIVGAVIGAILGGKKAMATA